MHTHLRQQASQGEQPIVAANKPAWPWLGLTGPRAGAGTGAGAGIGAQGEAVATQDAVQGGQQGAAQEGKPRTWRLLLCGGGRMTPATRIGMSQVRASHE